MTTYYLFCFVSYRSKPKQIANCQLLQLLYLLPISLTSLCTPLPGSFLLLQTHRYFVSPMLNQKPLAIAISPNVFQSNWIRSLLTSVTIFLHLQNCVKSSSTNDTNDFKFCLLTCLLIYPPSPLDTFLLHTCVWGIQWMYNYYFGSFNVCCWSCKAHPCWWDTLL